MNDPVEKQIEVWKNVSLIEGMEEYGDYEISNLGRVRSLNYNHTKKPRMLKSCLNRGGYLYVTLCSNGNRKNFYIHRLVLLAFVPNPQGYPDVNHIDENKMNNSVSNLEWCNKMYNNNFGTRNQRVAKKVLCIELNRIFSSVSEAAELLNISKGNISSVLTGKRHTTGGYSFKYYDKE